MLRIEPIDLAYLRERCMLKGRVHDRVFFVRGGKQLERALGDMTTERYWNDPKFEGSRAAMREFGASCALSGTIRKGFGQMAIDVGGKRPLHNKVVKRLLHSFKGLPGQRGNRVLDAVHIASRLKEVTWSKRGKIGLQPWGWCWETLEPFVYKPKVHFQFSDGAFKKDDWWTHLRPVVAVLALSNLSRHPKWNKYRPSRRKLHGECRWTYGTPMKLGEPTGLGSGAQGCGGEAWSVRPDLLFPEAVEAGCALVVAVGVEALELDAEGNILDSKFLAMQVPWSGLVEPSRWESEAQRTNAAEIGGRNSGPAPLTTEQGIGGERAERILVDEGIMPSLLRVEWPPG